MNCFSSGREVRRRWRSVPRSSVTANDAFSRVPATRYTGVGYSPTYMSSRGEMKMSLREMTYAFAINAGASADQVGEDVALHFRA